jgi:hypothetical protein
MIDKGYNIEPLPSVQFVGDDVSNAEEFLGKTAYYDPQEKMIPYTLMVVIQKILYVLTLTR